MKMALTFAAKSIIGGLLIVVPIYLAVLVLLKGMKSVVGLVRSVCNAAPGMDPSRRLGFIIEEFEDGRYAVFAPSIPTPLAGAVYILERKRVNPLNVPFTEASKSSPDGGRVLKNLL